MRPSLPEGLKSAKQLCLNAAARAFAPEPELTVSDWADRNRQLSSKASGEPGQWQTIRTPYLREIQDALTPSHPMTDGALMKGTQLGGSELIYNAIGYWAALVPCPIGLVMPTTDTCKRVSKQRLQPMIDATPALTKKFAEVKSRASSNTVLMKDFTGGVLVLMGANSGPGLRNMPLRVVLQDEIDAYPDDVDGEGDPCVLADKRADQFGRGKRFKCSTPKVLGKSRIHTRYTAGTQARYYVPCPHCQHEQWLRWQQMRWVRVRRREAICAACGGIDEIDAGAAGEHACTHCGAWGEIGEGNTRTVETDEVDRAWYECEGCGQEIGEHHKTWMLEQGRHIHHAPGPGEVLADDDPDPHAIWAMFRGAVRRFRPRFTRPLTWHVSGLYSPLGWFGWAKAVAQFLDAERGGYDEETGESLMQVFWNTVCGEAYEVPGEQPQVNVIKQRVEPYELRVVPAGGLMLTAFCDVQGDRLEVEVDAFGRGEECWLVDHQVLHGDPTKRGPGSVWEALAGLRDKAYPHAGGSTLRIAALGVDSGYSTQDVYDYCRRWAHRHVIATKGDNVSGKPVLGRPSWVDVNHRGKKIKRGVQLWFIGADTAKERLYRRLELQEPGPGYQHFPRGLPDEYFDQLTAEKLLRRTVRGLEKREWVKTRERNEALDLKVGCYAAAIYAGVQRVNWDQIEHAVNPAQRDLLAEAAKGAVQTPAADDNAADAAPPQGAADATDAETPAGRRMRRVNWVTGFH